MARPALEYSTPNSSIWKSKTSPAGKRPFGAHPTSLYRAYDYEAEHIQLYVEYTKTPEGFKAYLDKYVYSVKDHWEYLERIGGARRLNDLKADPILGYGKGDGHARS